MTAATKIYEHRSKQLLEHEIRQEKQSECIIFDNTGSRQSRICFRLQNQRNKYMNIWFIANFSCKWT